jgi:hypothetical protein
MNRGRFWIIFSAAISILAYSPSDWSAVSSSREEAAHGRAKDWMDSIQVYSYVATSIKNARHLSLTVNGVWNGCAMENTAGSLLPETFFWRFRSEKAFVANTHHAGMRHMSAIRCAFAHAQSFQERPELETGICRSLTGTFLKIPSWYIGNPCFMCQNSPIWQEYLLHLARRAIDSGTDAILLDEPFGDTFFSSACDPDLPGYSDWDLALFAKYLVAHFDSNELRVTFGLSDTRPSCIRDKLKDVDFKKWAAHPDSADSTQADRLWFRFTRSQLVTNLAAKRELVDGIRTYSKQAAGKEILIGGNLAGLGTMKFGTGTIPVLLLADLFDFVAFEMMYPPIAGASGGTLPFSIPPRAKWMPWYGLGTAIWGPHRILALPCEGPFMEWITGGKRVNYLCHLFAEAYSGQGALLINPVEEVAREPVARYARFIRENARFYQGYVDAAAVGVVYSYDVDCDSLQWSYWGLAQALYESGIPFSTIFVTSEKSRWSNLSSEALRKYRGVFLPMSRGLTGEQRGAISKYVREGGGTVILLEPDGGFSTTMEGSSEKQGAGRFIVMHGDSARSSVLNNDLGKAYWLSHSDECRKALVDAALACLPEGSSLGIPQEQHEWSAVAYSQPDSNRVIIHVLNYDYDADRDSFHPKENLLIHLNPSAFGLNGSNYCCTAFSPDREGSIDLTCVGREAYLEVAIPELQLYEVIVCRPREESSP